MRREDEEIRGKIKELKNEKTLFNDPIGMAFLSCRDDKIRLLEWVLGERRSS